MNPTPYYRPEPCLHEWAFRDGVVDWEASEDEFLPVPELNPWDYGLINLMDENNPEAIPRPQLNPQQAPRA